MAGRRFFGGKNGYDFAAPGRFSFGKSGETSEILGDLTVDGVPFVGDLVLSIPLVVQANHATQHLFLADRAYQLVSFEEVHMAASASGTLKLVKCTGTQAFGSGVDMLTTTISTAGANYTTVAGTLSATAANTAIADGDRIMLVSAGTPTNYVGGVVTIVLRPI